MSIQSFFNTPTYAPLEDGVYQATLTSFQAKQPNPEKDGYLEVILNVITDSDTRPLTVTLFANSIQFAVNALQRHMQMNGATGAEVFTATKESGLVFPITIWHKDGYRNVDFFERINTAPSSGSTLSVDPADDEDIPM